MVDSLKKIIGKSFFNYEEMHTTLLLTNVERILDSRQLTYLEEDNTEEALTRFHLLYVRKVNTENHNSGVVNVIVKKHSIYKNVIQS